MLCSYSYRLVDVSLAEDETFYHTIEPSEQTTYNMSISNPTPGPADLVSDIFSMAVEGVPPIGVLVYSLLVTIHQFLTPHQCRYKAEKVLICI